MKENCRGSEDGIRINDYQEGETYEVSDRLGKVFVESGSAALVGGIKGQGEGEIENAAKGPAPQNSAAKPKGKASPKKTK